MIKRNVFWFLDIFITVFIIPRNEESLYYNSDYEIPRASDDNIVVKTILISQKRKVYNSAIIQDAKSLLNLSIQYPVGWGPIHNTKYRLFFLSCH
jgi:hypothetical protein